MKYENVPIFLVLIGNDKIFFCPAKSLPMAQKLINAFYCHFRVIALGLPVPKYTGSPLDPPLRSRFQARDVQHLPYGQQLDILMGKVKIILSYFAFLIL